MEKFSDFKEALDYYLKQKGYTKAYLARTLGYRAPRLSKWIMQDNNIPHKVVNEICALLRLAPQQQMALFALAGYPFPSWVGNLLRQVQSPTIPENDEGLSFDPSFIGEYEGESYQCLFNEEGKKEIIPDTDNLEDFSISKVMGATIIEGYSLQKTTKALVSTWTGWLWKVVNGNTLYFGVDLRVDITETAIWVLEWTPVGLHGWFYSGRGNQRFTYELFANKKG